MKNISLSLIIFLITVAPCYSWENAVTHPRISEFTANKFYTSDVMEEIVNGKAARVWVRDGAELEDAGSPGQFLKGTARSLNHFHNPTKAKLEEAGLSDLPFFIPNGESALLWAQDGSNQTKHWEDWSWQAVRKYYLRYLLEMDPTQKDVLRSDVLKGLGYQMHMIQDMSQPNHVRNDTHLVDGVGIYGLETWAAKNDDKVRDILNNLKAIPEVTVDLSAPFSVVPSPPPISLSPVGNLFDTRVYLGSKIPSALLNQGLAEYTNANFFSEHTAFAAEVYSPSDAQYFAHPSKAETNIQKYIDANLDAVSVADGEDAYVSFIVAKPAENTTGEPMDCLAGSIPSTRKYLRDTGESGFFYGSFITDPCFEQYANKLIPLAASYSKAMLKYFYRGNIELTLPDEPESYNYISLKARNVTKNGEELKNAKSVNLVIKYKQMVEDSAQGKLVQEPVQKGRDPYHYLVVPVTNVDGKIPDIPKDTTVDLDFDLTETPLPIWAYDITLQVVFEGDVGNETGAVAVGTTTLTTMAGDIDLSLPFKGIYAITTPDGSFKEFRIKALNFSADQDSIDMPAGKIELVLWYRRSNTDPFQNVSTDRSPLPPEYYYTRVAEKNNVSALQVDQPTDLVFDISDNPLPLWATDVRLFVVYTGTVGSATNEIAVGFRDIAEPTPIDFINNMDYVCIKSPDPDTATGSLVPAGSQEAINAVGTDAGGMPKMDIYSHRLKDVYVAFTSVQASSQNFSAKFPDIEPGQYGRVFVLTDYIANASSSVTVENINGPLEDPWGYGFLARVDILEAMRNQIPYYPSMDTERGLLSWWYLRYNNQPWPAGTTCDSSGATPLTGPVSVLIPQVE